MAESSRTTAGKRLARQAAYFIREHSEQKFSLSGIAGALFVNGNYLARVFRRETGRTLLWYHNHTRCENAKRLLTSDRSISQVGEETGFVSSAHFSHVFRKTTGMTPSEFRSGSIRQ